MKRLFKQEKT